MRIGKRRTITQKTTDATELCELCGGECPGGSGGGWDHTTVTIEARIGSIYPETDFRDVYETEVCADCFVLKVVPALEALGCKVRKRDAEAPWTAGEYFDRVDEETP
jgi:hypothetical protein